MRKFQRPIRNTCDELFDQEWSWEKREQVRTAYDQFFDTLDEELSMELKMMLF